MRINLKELSYYKNIARKLGGENTVIKTIPSFYSYGHISEIAVMGILGRLQRMLQMKKVYFFIESHWINDINEECDLLINKEPVQLQSKYSYNSLLNYEDCTVEYDQPGISNLNTVLEYIGKHINIDDTVVSDINSIWKGYMEYYGITG